MAASRPPFLFVPRFKVLNTSVISRLNGDALDSWTRTAAVFFLLPLGVRCTPKKAPQSVKSGLSSNPIPVILLARLAVDSAEQGRGLGAALLKDGLSANDAGGRDRGSKGEVHA